MMSASGRTAHNIARIQRVLDVLYPQPPVPLNSRGTFTFLVAVVLSAQTTDGKVNDVTKVLFERASTPLQMSALDPAEVESMIKSVGLAPKKAVYLVELSKKLVSDFNSVVPGTYKELESLPGVGHKTASVLMSQSFGHPALAVDTHVHRLANRWGLSNHKNVDMVQKDLMEIFPQDHWNKLHLQMIYFGREFCTAKDHTVLFWKQPAKCPVCSFIAPSDKPLPPLDELNETLIRAQFAATKRVKGIVYYQDRTDQLKTESHLILGTPSPIVPMKIKRKNIELTHAGAITSLSMAMGAESKEDSIIMKRHRRSVPKSNDKLIDTTAVIDDNKNASNRKKTTLQTYTVATSRSVRSRRLGSKGAKSVVVRQNRQRRS